MAAYTKLDPAFKAAWVAALTSGKFTQNRGTLGTSQKVTSCLCCIGVGAAVKLNKPAITRYDCDTTIHAAMICGLNSNTQQFLTEANDTHEWEFPQISRWINENL